jgi:uncharacterized membrane protein YjfL (UPF0719 family)
MISLLLNVPLVEGIQESAIYAGIGIVLAVLSFFVVDWITPGNMREQIAKENNTALAILAGSMMIGISIIIAAAIG